MGPSPLPEALKLGIISPTQSKPMSLRFAVAAITLLPVALAGQTAPTSGVRPQRLIIRNAMIVDGNGTPAKGPFDITVVDNVITQVSPRDPVATGGRGGGRAASDASAVEIDATGKYVLPGLINAHAHLQDERAGVPQPIEYEFKIWLACGITTIRDVGSTTRKGARLARLEREGTDRGAAHSRLSACSAGRRTSIRRGPASARSRPRASTASRSSASIATSCARWKTRRTSSAFRSRITSASKRPTPGTTSTSARRASSTGTAFPTPRSPDGVQGFPSYYNYNNETDRFRWAGHLWREADPARLSMVLDSMVARHVAWVPTFDIYEASRDLQRARTQPWFADYLHPTLEDYFKPDPANHGSYFFGWSSTDETYWKENYRIWMAAVRDFERKGGLVGAGDDAGFIYQMYGFGLLRELELHQEAGFSTIKVIQHATGNNARILGKENEIGRIRPGLSRRPDRRQRQPARESESALSDRRRRDQGRQDGSHRRHRMDDQGRHSIPRPDADARGEGARRQSAGGAQTMRLNWRYAVVAASACALLSCGGGSEPTPPVLTTVSVSLSASTISVGQTATATASGSDQKGAAISVGTVTWTSGSTSIATVSSSGVVTAVAPGQTTIIATSGGKQGSASITVLPSSPQAKDFAITGAQFTQGVQVADGSIPMVLSGDAAVVNVLVRSVPTSSASMQIVLRIFDATGALIRTDTVVMQGSLGASPTYDSPSVQFLVPASVLKGGLKWQVVRDPKLLVPDDSLSTDVFPRTGTASLATVSVPALNIRFVPIVLAAHGGHGRRQHRDHPAIPADAPQRSSARRGERARRSIADDKCGFRHVAGIRPRTRRSGAVLATADRRAGSRADCRPGGTHRQLVWSCRPSARLQLHDLRRILIHPHERDEHGRRNANLGRSAGRLVHQHKTGARSGCARDRAHLRTLACALWRGGFTRPALSSARRNARAGRT